MKTNRKYLNVILLFFLLLMQTYSAKDDNLYISEGSQTEAPSGATESSDDTIDSIIDETNNEITGSEGGTVPSETNSDIENIINAELEKTKLDPTQGVTPKVGGVETQKSKIDPKKHTLSSRLTFPFSTSSRVTNMFITFVRDAIG